MPIAEEHIITRQNKRMVLFAGLLAEAHAKGLRSIETDLLQVPSEENGNVAICTAVVEMEDGRKFSGIGDASPDNVGRNIAPHIIRMAETRAKARALRDAINVGEALADDESTAHEDEPAPRSGQSGQRGQGQGQGRGNVREHPTANRQQGQGQGRSTSAGHGGQGGGQHKKGERQGERQGDARKSQKDLLRALAEEWAGEGGVERLENRLGKPIDALSRAEADEWIDRLNPEGREEGPSDEEPPPEEPPEDDPADLGEHENLRGAAARATEAKNAGASSGANSGEGGPAAHSQKARIRDLHNRLRKLLPDGAFEDLTAPDAAAWISALQAELEAEQAG